MNKKLKAYLLVLSAVMLIATSVFGTFAYLTDTAEAINTFTVGKVEIKLDEAKVDEYGVKDGETRVTENTYKLLPGHTYTKDPIVHVGADSENCYLFVKVVNEIANIEDATTIANQMEAKGWVSLSGAENVYYYNTVVEKGASDKDIEVFESFKIKGDVKNAELANYAEKTITITAYAVQQDGFTDAAAAWNATFGAPTE